MLRPPSADAVGLAGLWAAVLDVGVMAAAVVIAVNLWAPPQDLPWKPLRLDQPVGVATAMKFRRAADDPAMCRKVLAEGGVRFTEVPDRAAGACTVVNTLRLQGGPIMTLAPAGPVMTCPAALGYAFWSRHSVQPAARELLGSPIAQVDHYGTYACRNIYGRAEGRRSEHAFANALDVAGFRTRDGQRLTVAGDFRDDGPHGVFLRRVRTEACVWFRATLSPDYNAAHRDHLHLDGGRYRVCS